jgi:hypothetical protein
MKHPLGAESPPPVEHEGPGVHRQRPSRMISDQQRGLLGQALPTGRLKPEVVLAQGIPNRLLSPHQSLVGTFEGVFGRGGDALGDEAFDSPLGSPLGARGLGHRPLPGRWSRDGCHEDSPPTAWRASSPERTPNAHQTSPGTSAPQTMLGTQPIVRRDPRIPRPGRQDIGMRYPISYGRPAAGGSFLHTAAR